MSNKRARTILYRQKFIGSQSCNVVQSAAAAATASDEHETVSFRKCLTQHKSLFPIFFFFVARMVLVFVCIWSLSQELFAFVRLLLLLQAGLEGLVAFIDDDDDNSVASRRFASSFCIRSFFFITFCFYFLRLLLLLLLLMLVI